MGPRDGALSADTSAHRARTGGTRAARRCVLRSRRGARAGVRAGTLAGRGAGRGGRGRPRPVGLCPATRAGAAAGRRDVRGGRCAAGGPVAGHLLLPLYPLYRSPTRRRVGAPSRRGGKPSHPCGQLWPVHADGGAAGMARARGARARGPGAAGGVSECVRRGAWVALDPLRRIERDPNAPRTGARSTRDTPSAWPSAPASHSRNRHNPRSSNDRG